MKFTIVCINGELIYTGHESSLSGGDFEKKTGMPVGSEGNFHTWWEFKGKVEEAREALGLPPAPEVEEPGPMPGPIPIPPKPEPKPIEELTDRELLIQTRRTLRRMEHKINYMFDVIKIYDDED